MNIMAAQCATDTLNNPLWQYALAVYGRPGVAPELLRLQDENGCDVLWLLTALWLGERGVALTTADLTQPGYSACREDQILPLRAERRACDKASDPERYEALKQSELNAEQQGLALLYQAFHKRSADGGTVADNLRLLTPHATELGLLIQSAPG